MGIFAYNVSPTSTDTSAMWRYLGSSSASAGLTLTSEGIMETAGPGKNRRLSLSETRDLQPGDDEVETD